MTCATCGAAIDQKPRGRPRLYCSNRCRKARQSRAVEYANRNAKRRAVRTEPLPALFPDLRHGARVSFWEDELRMDLRQEETLAMLEGRDPKVAVAAYRSRETSWRAHTRPISVEI